MAVSESQEELLVQAIRKSLAHHSDLLQQMSKEYQKRCALVKGLVELAGGTRSSKLLGVSRSRIYKYLVEERG